LEALAGRSCTLTITHRWDRARSNVPQTPSGELRDEDFVAVAPRATYKVEFATDGTSVEVGERPMVGKLSEGSPARFRYTLGDGTFAGGRFTVRADDGTYRAELTIYGSGLPITQSKRGDLDCRD
jgi:hypothetical protein